MPVMMEHLVILGLGAWHRADNDLLLTVIDGPQLANIAWIMLVTACWASIFWRADDVIADGFPGSRLPSNTQLTVHLPSQQSPSCPTTSTELLQLASIRPAHQRPSGPTMPYQRRAAMTPLKLLIPKAMYNRDDLPARSPDQAGMVLRCRRGQRWHQAWSVVSIHGYH